MSEHGSGSAGPARRLATAHLRVGAGYTAVVVGFKGQGAGWIHFKIETERHEGFQ
jgi:hypothetical protein